MRRAHVLGSALRIAVAVALAGVSSLIAACGGDEGGSTFERDKFAGMYMAEITYDCEQSVQCKAQQGGTLLENNPIGACALETGELLNSSGERQESFLANYGRCAAFVVCDYVNCANAEGVSYGDSQRPKLTPMCAAQVECNALRGLSGDTQGLCIERKVNELNSFIPTRRQMWEASYDACEGMAGCTFIECFDAAFLGATGP